VVMVDLQRKGGVGRTTLKRGICLVVNLKLVLVIGIIGLGR
jgi:Tfp pilus assembly protein PilX